MKKLITIWCVLICVASQSQDIEKWKKQLELHIRDQSKNDSFFRINTRFTITAIPICYYPCSGSDLFNKKKMCRLAIDSFASFGFLSMKDQVAGVVENRGTGRYGFYSVAEQQRLKRKESDDVTLQMIKLGSSFSSKYCFIYFFPDERNRYDVLAAFVEGKPVFINRKLKIYKELPALLMSQYGKSQKQIQNQLDDQYIRQKLQKEMTLEEAKELTEQDYIQYSLNHPKDTTGILKKFLDEFTQYVPLDTMKKVQLREKILRDLERAPLFKDKKKSYRIPFLSRNIFPLVEPFATDQQLNEYKKYRTLRNWLVKKAYEKLDWQ